MLILFKNKYSRLVPVPYLKFANDPDSGRGFVNKGSGSFRSGSGVPDELIYRAIIYILYIYGKQNEELTVNIEYKIQPSVVIPQIINQRSRITSRFFYFLNTKVTGEIRGNTFEKKKHKNNSKSKSNNKLA